MSNHNHGECRVGPKHWDVQTRICTHTQGKQYEYCRRSKQCSDPITTNQNIKMFWLTWAGTVVSGQLHGDGLLEPVGHGHLHKSFHTLYCTLWYDRQAL